MSEKQNARVLIVDDMKVNRMILSSLLSSNGVANDLAESGRECLELSRKNAYDLILLDHRMPDMDGVDTLVELKKLFKEQGREVTVICHTTDDGKKNINLYKAAGFADVLIKPIQPQHLSEILMTYLPDGRDTVDEKERLEREKTEKEIEKLPEWLKQIPGVDLFSGVEHCETAEDYLDALNVFAASIREKSNEIKNFFEKQDWQKYTLKVHSLKSMARVVGAEELGELAAQLEVAGRNGEISVITEKTPVLLKEYDAFIPLFRPLAGEDEKDGIPQGADTGQEISEEKLSDAYTTIGEFAAVYDAESIRMVLDSLKEYRLSEQDEKRVKEISDAVSDAEWENLRNILEKK